MSIMQYKLSKAYEGSSPKTVEDLIESLKALPPKTLIHDIGITTTEDSADDWDGLNKDSYITTHIEFDIKKYVKSTFLKGVVESFYI